MRERVQKFGDPGAKINGQAQDRAQLNDDRVHLPIAVTQIDVKQRLSNAEVCGRADRQELRQALDNAKNRRKKVVVQYSSRLGKHLTQNYAPSPITTGTDAGTARCFAQSLRAWISSARVVESGTVRARAAASICVVSDCLLANAAYKALCTAASISAPEKPCAAAAIWSKSNSAGFRLRFANWMAKICLRSAGFGRSTKNNSSKRPLRISSGGRAVTLLQVAATNTVALRSCIHERNEARIRDETPASTEAESGPLPANTFSSSSIQSTHGDRPSATRNTSWIRFSVSPMYLSN